MTPSTVRRDIFENLVASADTPTASNNHHVASESKDIRLVKELKRTHDEKAHVLRKAARLQEQVHQLQKRDPTALVTVVQLAEQSGEVAAISWARQQVSNACHQPPVSQVSRTRVHTCHFLLCLLALVSHLTPCLCRLDSCLR
jgi:hypothetical protein